MSNKAADITTIGALANALVIQWGSRKTHAEIFYAEDSSCTVREYFDDGKGHSDAFTTQYSNVDLSVFAEARSKRYVQGKLMPGYVSTIQFVLTTNTDLLNEIQLLAQAWCEQDYYNMQSEREVRQGKPGTYIKVVAIPAGDAPDYVREAWVSLVLPCDSVVSGAKLVANGEAVVWQPVIENDLYVVKQEDALRILSERNQKAASWWHDQGLPSSDEHANCFCFKKVDVVEFAGNFKS